MTEASRLAVLVDGAPLDPEPARALWTEFSAHMDENKGDMSGFAKKKGWVSVAPEYQQGKAVLVVKTGAPMKAAVKAPMKAAKKAAPPAKPAARPSPRTKPRPGPAKKPRR